MASRFTISPLVATKAGNRNELMLKGGSDPILLAKRRWNKDWVLEGERPEGTTAPQDGVPYAVAGSPKPFCWPHVKVAWRSGFQPGPSVRFEQRDDGMHLNVVFEEDPSKRLPNCVPFSVKIKSIQLFYGSTPTDVLNFPEPLPEPMDPERGPAFTIEADAVVPLDENRARLVSAMQILNGARWVVTMEFEWVHTIPPDSGNPDSGHPIVIDPGVLRPIRPWPPVGILDPEIFRPGVVNPGVIRPVHPIQRADEVTAGGPGSPEYATTSAAAPKTDISTFVNPEVIIGILRKRPPVLRPSTEVATITYSREVTAGYPKDAPENRPIFAAVTGDYVQIGWKNTAHGWFQPTPIQDTVYCLPEAYRLEVDEVTGLPAIQAVLLPKTGTDANADPLDARNYRTRLTLKARPDFDAEQLNALRALIRAQSSDTVRFADLVLGGYNGARFVPDPALAGLGELFAGSTAGVRDAINPEAGFTLTYEGNAEFIDLLFQRLKGEGIQGSVELDLQEPGGTVRKQTIPVVLTLRKLAGVSLPWTFLIPAPAPAPDGEEPDPMNLLPRDLQLKNPTGIELTLGQVQAHALQKSPVTGHVEGWFRATPDGNWPRVIAPNGTETVRLSFEGETPIFNTWDVSLVDCHTQITADLVLTEIFDASTSGVRGWKVSVDCPPLQFFDQLSPDDQARFRDVVALEVEVRRKGSTESEEVRLTRQSGTGIVLLSRTVADFVSDRSVGRSLFEFRQRSVRLTRADNWSQWQEESGSAISVFLA